jgi:hypothetical protein
MNIGSSAKAVELRGDDRRLGHGFMPTRPGMKPEAAKPLAGGQRSATTGEAAAKNHPAGMAASRLRTVSASGTVAGFLLSADFAD